MYYLYTLSVCAALLQGSSALISPPIVIIHTYAVYSVCMHAVLAVYIMHAAVYM
jgi:hypothetical protein